MELNCQKELLSKAVHIRQLILQIDKAKAGKILYSVGNSAIGLSDTLNKMSKGMRNFVI